VRVGVSLAPNSDDHDKLVELAVAADGAGLDLIGIQDHPYQRRFLDTWMLIADLLARTERISIFPDVANLPLRPPAMMAKAAMSLDAMSGGRFELGLGAGALWDRVATMGGPRRSPGEGVDALSEAIDVLRLAWSGEESVSYRGEYYSVDGFEPGPPPAHPIGIWLGAYKPRMLRLVGEKADGWIPSVFYQGTTPESLGESGRAVDRAAEAAGRDPADVLRLWNIGGDHPAESLAGWARDQNVDGFVFLLDTSDRGAALERIDQLGGLRAELG
jgi:alkanesulfonate monooxygenase SsuD/methylene tetrahydromethanopterin reductase-like flavin-dependent oxidoreductase (luciferase family)